MPYIGLDAACFLVRAIVPPSGPCRAFTDSVQAGAYEPSCFLRGTGEVRGTSRPSLSCGISRLAVMRPPYHGMVTHSLSEVQSNGNGCCQYSARTPATSVSIERWLTAFPHLVEIGWPSPSIRRLLRYTSRPHEMSCVPADRTRQR